VPESKRNEFTVPPGPSILERTEQLLLETMRKTLLAESSHEQLLLRGECQGIAKALSVLVTPFSTPNQLLSAFRAKAQGTLTAPEVPRLESRRYNLKVEEGYNVWHRLDLRT